MKKKAKKQRLAGDQRNDDSLQAHRNQPRQGENMQTPPSEDDQEDGYASGQAYVPIDSLTSVSVDLYGRLLNAAALARLGQHRPVLDEDDSDDRPLSGTTSPTSDRSATSRGSRRMRLVLTR